MLSSPPHLQHYQKTVFHYYINMKSSLCILLTFLTLLPVSQTTITTLSYTGSQDPYQFSPGGIQDNNGESLAPPAITTIPNQPSDWTFLEENSIGGQASWIHPTNSFQSHPHGYIVTYTSSFNVDCPQQPISIKIAATGAVFSSINDKWQLIWGLPWPEVHHLQVHQDNLKCGCNNIRIDVFNAWWSSPAALIHNVSQDQTNCYFCQNEGITYYNRGTCQCECASEPCECNSNQKWFDYPRCGCMCDILLKCLSNRYLNRKSCTCDCLPKCCPKGQFMNSNTCLCQKLSFSLPQSIQPKINSPGVINLKADFSDGNP